MTRLDPGLPFLTCSSTYTSKVEKFCLQIQCKRENETQQLVSTTHVGERNDIDTYRCERENESDGESESVS